MKLLFINHNVTGAGTFLRAYHLARHLCGRGHEVTLLATSPTSRFGVSETAEGRVRVVAFPDLLAGRLRNGVCLWNTLQRVLYLRRRTFDLIHAFDTRPVVIFPALYYRAMHDVPLVIDWADWWGRGGTIRERSSRLYSLTLGRVETFFEEYFRGFADGATAISSVLKKRLASLGYPEEKTFLLRNGTDFSSPPPPGKEACRKALGLDPGSPLIGHLGTLFEKDARLLFASLKILAEKRPDARLLLIGRHRLKLEKHPGARDFVAETGEIPREKISLHLAACDLLVLPLERNIANHGRWPSKVNDYFASGRPVVSTPVGDVRTIFESEGIGLLAGDRPEEFSRVLEELLGDRERRALLGRRALAYARENLDWRLIAREAEKFYNKIASRERRRRSIFTPVSMC